MVDDLISLYLIPNSDAIRSVLTKYIISLEYIIPLFNKALITLFQYHYFQFYCQFFLLILLNPLYYVNETLRLFFAFLIFL